MLIRGWLSVEDVGSNFGSSTSGVTQWDHDKQDTHTWHLFILQIQDTHIQAFMNRGDRPCLWQDGNMTVTLDTTDMTTGDLRGPTVSTQPISQTMACLDSS